MASRPGLMREFWQCSPQAIFEGDLPEPRTQSRPDRPVLHLSAPLDLFVKSSSEVSEVSRYACPRERLAQRMPEHELWTPRRCGRGWPGARTAECKARLQFPATNGAGRPNDPRRYPLLSPTSGNCGRRNFPWTQTRYRATLSARISSTCLV